MDLTIPDEPTAMLLTEVCAGSPKATTGFPVEPSTERPVARTDEPRRETQSETIPHSKFVRTWPTVELLSNQEVVYPQNFMVEQPKNNISDTPFMHYAPFTHTCPCFHPDKSSHPDEQCWPAPFIFSPCRSASTLLSSPASLPSWLHLSCAPSLLCGLL